MQVPEEDEVNIGRLVAEMSTRTSSSSSSSAERLVYNNNNIDVGGSFFNRSFAQYGEDYE